MSEAPSRSLAAFRATRRVSLAPSAFTARDGRALQPVAMLDFVDVQCPACGEPLQLAIDTSAGAQAYVEDCQVCCRPLLVRVSMDDDGLPDVAVESESH